MRKRYILLILLLLAITTGIIVRTMFVTGADLSNSKTYDSNTRTITIKSSGTNVLTARLDTPSVYQVKIGYNKIGEITINPYTNYSNLLNKFNFYDLKTGDLVIKTIDLKYLKEAVTDDYSCINIADAKNGTNESCILIGTHPLGYYEWIDWNGEVTKDNNLTIGLFTDVLPNEIIEWVPTIAGVSVNEWAVYTSGATSFMDGSYTVTTFANNGTFNITNGLTNVTLLLIGGGGGGGGNSNTIGGGGGGGGLIYETNMNLTAGNYHVIVGSGGTGGIGNNPGTSGGNSSIFGLVAYGGGGGGNNSGAGGVVGLAGSNGGGSSGVASGGTGTQINFSNGTAFGGFDGGTSAAAFGAGGGGGPFQAGKNGAAQIGGNSSNPYWSNINGTNTSYACGAAGGGTNAGYSGRGLTYGCTSAGGYFISAITSSGYNATNPGSGGGGSGYNGTGGTFNGGNGFAGIVILRYINSTLSTLNVHMDDPPNSTTFTYPFRPGLYTWVNSTNASLTISNMTILVNFSNGTNFQTYTNNTGINGYYNGSFTYPNLNNTFLWTATATSNNGTTYSASNGTFLFNILQNYSITAPNQSAYLPDFNMTHNDLLSIAWNTYFSHIGTGSNAYINLSFFDYKEPLLQSIIPINLSTASTGIGNYTTYLTPYYVIGSYRGPTLQAMELISYDQNRTIQMNVTACNDGGCVVGNRTMIINISEATNSSQTFISKTSSWFSRILPAAENTSFLQKFGLMFIIMLFISIALFIGSSAANVEAPANAYIVLGINILLIVYFIAIGYLSIWLVFGLGLVIFGLTYFGRRNG